MLQAHSILWHYLWLAPHILALLLAWLMYRRGAHRLFPIFFVYLSFSAIKDLLLYAMDVLPSVSGLTFWRAFSAGMIVEGLIKFALIGELSRHLLERWTALGKLSHRLITGAGAILVLLATLAAAYAPIDNPQYAIISRAHILEQTLYFVQCGLILVLFLFAGYFRVGWEHRSFGIALGLGIVACEHLATWAVMANGFMPDKRALLDFLNMATYHACVLIWFYYLLTPQKVVAARAVPLPENSLELWNRELERLLQQ
jgi:hypothetical protein